jgi:hypothetical protein
METTVASVGVKPLIHQTTVASVGVKPLIHQTTVASVGVKPLIHQSELRTYIKVVLLKECSFRFVMH